jgi:predicted phage-related endonuclease
MNLLERAVVDKNVDEFQWLEERRKGVTATEVSKLAKGQPAVRRNLLAEKETGESSFHGNRYTNWGLEREQVIAGEMEVKFGFEASDILFFSDSNQRHLATPDAIYLAEDHNLIAEIKTSKHNLASTGSHFQKSTYQDQMQWQLYVCNAMRCLYAWEQHDDNWVEDEFGVERPTPTLRTWEWIERDDARIAELVLIADEFLAEMDWNNA